MHELFRYSRKWWLGAIALVVIWAFAAWTSTEPLEADLAARSNAAVKDALLDKKRVTVAGRDVTFSAEAFSSEGRRAALSAVETVPGVRLVNDETRLVPEAKPFVWTAERDVVRVTLAGSASSKAPNIDEASATKRAARPNVTQMLESAEPISMPVATQARPIGVKRTAIPRTKAPESAAPRSRDFASVAPKMETVIGTIG